MLSGAILYHSNTGNTLAACRYVQKHIQCANLDLIDMMRCGQMSLAKYSVVGFAFFTDTWRPPALFLSRCAALSDAAGKAAFSLNTYGCISGQSARIMCRTLNDMGMTVVGAHSLHTPENYPPMVAGGHAYAESPNEKELAQFDAFIHTLDERFAAMEATGAAPAVRAKVGLNALVPAHADKLMNLVFGRTAMQVDAERCVCCGKCASLCPAGAISMQPHAVIGPEKCTHCWSCYNHCPRQAVYSGKFTGQGQYPSPPDAYLKKLS